MVRGWWWWWCVCLLLISESQSATERSRVVTSALNMLETILMNNREQKARDQGRVRDTPGTKILTEGVYDFIVVGGGTTGCVVANRLSENPKWKVLLLEAGQDETILNEIPALSSFFALTDNDWGYVTEPQSDACLAMKGRRCVWPRGKILGGSSSINHLIYSRAHRLDFDEWAHLGNKGWSYNEVLPYFKKFENMLIPELKDSRYHSTGGPLPVELSYHSTLGQAFVSSGLERGFNATSDYNGDDPLGFSIHHVMTKEGLRYSASKTFLRTVSHRQNLHVSLNSRVTKVIINPSTRRAVGVEFSKNRLLYSIRAKREVILSAGALNSPQILMLSGVGPRKDLSQLGIPVIQDLKVGYNLQDHVGFLGLTYVVNDDVQVSMSPTKAMTSLLQFVFSVTGPLTQSAAVESLAFIRTKYAQDVRPDIEFLFTTGGLPSGKGGPLITKGVGIPLEFYNRFYRSVEDKNVWSVIPILLKARSRGRIQLKDKNPFHHPLFDPKYFSDRRDMKLLVEGIKMAVKVADTAVLRGFGSRLHNFTVPECASLEYGSDGYWECSVRYLTAACHHQVGTCKMGPSTDEEAVVDPKLKVYGVRGLRVADTSVIPLQVSGHLTATAYMIGEKVSDLIKAAHSS